MAGLGKTRPGYASKGGEEKRAPKAPSASEQREHAGRTPQPGVPAGPRNTEYPSASGYEYSPQTYAKTGLTPPSPAKAAVAAQARHAARVKRIVALVTAKPPKRPQIAAPKAPVVPKVAAAKVPVFKPTGVPFKYEGKKTAGAPTNAELKAAAKQGTLKTNKGGFVTTPNVRKASRNVKQARKVVAKTNGPPKIAGLHTKEQAEFADYLSKFTGIPPKLAGEWVKQESGGSSAGQGGEAGEQNQLGVGYPAHPTSFSESKFFNNTTPKAAAKATAKWMEGKIGAKFNYQAAPSIQGIPKLAKSGASEGQIRSYIEGPSAWGTGQISQSGVSVVSKGGSNPQAVANLQAAEQKAKSLGLKVGKPAGDLSPGGERTIKVRADAQGMVKWAESVQGTKESTPRQLRWASNEGLGAGEPWCANFVSNGLQRRGIKNLPSNPNYVPSYESDWAKYSIGTTDLSKAKPGDLVTFSGEHIGLYIGSGEMISGNFGNEVSRDPVSADSTAISMILRPPYKGGFIKVKESTPLPGSTVPASTSSSAPAAVGLAAAPTSGSAKSGGKQPKAKAKLPTFTVAGTEKKLQSLSSPDTGAPSTSVLNELERKYG